MIVRIVGNHIAVEHCDMSYSIWLCEESNPNCEFHLRSVKKYAKAKNYAIKVSQVLDCRWEDLVK